MGLVDAFGEWSLRRDPGVKLGASALSFVEGALAAPGMETGAELDVADPAETEG